MLKFEKRISVAKRLNLFWILRCSEYPSTSPIPAVSSHLFTVTYTLFMFAHLFEFALLLTGLSVTVFVLRPRVAVNAAELIDFITFNPDLLHRVAVLPNSAGHLHSFGMPVVANFFFFKACAIFFFFCTSKRRCSTVTYLDITDCLVSWYNCPLRSVGTHLSASDSFLWCYLKSKVYVRKPRTVDDL